jgi:hypothetical protein
VAAAYWLGPADTTPPAIHLLIVGDADDAAPGTEATLRAHRDEDDGVQRFALPLVVQNVGNRPGQPTRVTFSVPSRFRIVTARGALPSEVTPGVPLRRYVLPVAAPLLQPGDPPSSAARPRDRLARAGPARLVLHRPGRRARIRSLAAARSCRPRGD